MGNSASCSTDARLPDEGDLAIDEAPLPYDVAPLSERMNDALARAEAEGKQVLLLFGVDWCEWSTRLSATVDSSVVVREIVDESYVVVRVNYDDDKDGCEEYAPDIEHTPWLTVVNAEGGVVAQQGTAQLEKGEGHDSDKLYLFLFLNRAAVEVGALPPILVVSGPESAAVVRTVVDENPEVFERVLLYTSRDPRVGETSGVDRYFTSRQGIKAARDAGEMLAWVDAAGVDVAVSLESMGAVAHQSKVCVMDLGVQACPDALRVGSSSTVSFFIAPASKLAFEENLRAGAEGALGAAEIATRLRLADEAMAALSADESRFDIVLINDAMEETCNRVRSVAFETLQGNTRDAEGADDDAVSNAPAASAPHLPGLRAGFLTDSGLVLQRQAAALEKELDEARAIAMRWGANLAALCEQRIALQETARVEGAQYVDTLVSLLGIDAAEAEEKLAAVQSASSVEAVPKAARAYVRARLELGALAERTATASRELAGLETDSGAIEQERAARKARVPSAKYERYL